MKRNRLDFRKSSPTPLLILAGLPHSICTAVAKTVESNCRPQLRVVFQASGNNDAQLYKPATLEALICAVSGYAERQRRASQVPPAPEHVLLAYIPSDDDQRLLKEFEFFAFPIRLTRLAEFDYGRQLRHDLRIASDYVLSSLQLAWPVFAEIKRRLSSPSEKDPLFLPPKNFWVSERERMADVFSEFLRQRLAWNDPLLQLSRVNVTHEDLPNNLRPGAHRSVLCDSRGLLFPHDHSNHGVSRELLEDSSVRDRQLLLRSNFRFGVRLSDGYHHDVQFCGRDLGGQEFNCAVAGNIRLRCSHASVYPNDYVRPSKT